MWCLKFCNQTPIAQVVKAADCTLTSFDGVRQLLHDAYKLECSVVTFANARLVNGRVMVDMIKEELLKDNRLEYF